MTQSDYKLIPLRARGGTIVRHAKVDVEDFERFGALPWHRDAHGYARNGDGLLLHRAILGLADPSIKTDHINRDRLDNCRVNLRPVSDAGNAQNRSLFSNNTSGHRGVGWCKRTQRWQAYGRIDGQQKFLGRFDNLEEAARAAAAWRAANHPYSEEARDAR